PWAMGPLSAWESPALTTQRPDDLTTLGGDSAVKAVVMAGGEGSRLRPLTYLRPKPMVPIANRPVMEHILLLLKRHGIRQVVATLHYRADDIEAYFGDGSALGLELV